MTDAIHGTTTYVLSGGAEVRRLGYGAMRLTGPGVWGPPPDLDDAKRLLRRAVDLGVNFVDTADSYGPDVNEELIADALAPFPDDLVIATKAGLVRPGPDDWRPNGRPEHLRAACEGSLRRLRLERIPLYQLHRIDPDVPLEESVGTLAELRAEGKIDRIGLSEVSVAQLRRAAAVTEIASVQNRFSVADAHEWGGVVDACARDGVMFIPWYPLAAGDLGSVGDALDRVAGAHGTTRYAVALAWLLHRAPNVVVIPGTSSIDHLEENLGAAHLVDDIEPQGWELLQPPDRAGDRARRLVRRVVSEGSERLRALRR